VLVKSLESLGFLSVLKAYHQIVSVPEDNDDREVRISLRIVPGTDCAALRYEICIGRRSPAFPATPPGIRVRTGRFGGWSYRPPVNLGIPSESK
jgi:hypothetical protein